MTAGLERDTVLDWYRRNRARSVQLFDMLAERKFAAGAGFSVRGPWVDAAAGFALSLMQAT